MEMNKHHAAHHATHHTAHMEHAIPEENLNAVSGGTGATLEVEELQPIKHENDLKVILKGEDNVSDTISFQKTTDNESTITVEPFKGMIL